jgi:hypothetical protein
MNRDELWDSTGDLGTYLEILCKAIVLDKVKIVNGRIIVESLDD